MRVARDLIWRTAETTGLNGLLRRRDPARLLVVCYHGICPDDSAERHWLLVRRGTFVRQLDYLRSHFRILPLDDALVELFAGDLEEPTAAITFDDGYRNNHSVAWAELRSRRIPATIFLATGLISTSSSLWTTTLEYAVRGSAQPVLDLREWSGPCLSLSSPALRSAAGHLAKEYLKNLPVTTRREMLETILARLGPSAVPAEFRFMTWDDVHEMGNGGLIRFGAHTVNHEILSRLDDAALDREVRESVSRVAALGPAASGVFAFPNGRREDFDDRALEALAGAGVSAAVTTIPGTNSPRSRPMMLRRLVVDEGMTLARFSAEAGGVIAMMHDAATNGRANAQR